MHTLLSFHLDADVATGAYSSWYYIGIVVILLLVVLAYVVKRIVLRTWFPEKAKKEREAERKFANYLQDNSERRGGGGAHRS